MAGLLDDLLSTLNSAQTPWAQEAMRRMLAGEDVAGADAAIAARTARKPAPVPRDAPPPSADVRNPGQSADPFQAGEARRFDYRDLTTQEQKPEDIVAAGPRALFQTAPNLPAGEPPAPVAPMPQAQPQSQPRATPAPARGVPSAPQDLGAPNPLGQMANNFLRNLTGADFDIGGKTAELRRQTYQAVLDSGGSEANARLAANDPRVFMAMLPSLKKPADQWKIEKVGETEDARAVYAWVNPRTRETRPVTQGNMPTIPAAAPTAQQVVPTGPTAPGSPPIPAARPPGIASAVPAPPDGVNPIEYRKEMAKKLAEADAKRPASEADDRFKLKDMIGSIDDSWSAAHEIVQHPGFPHIAGLPFGGEFKIKGVGFDAADVVPGTSKADAFNLHKSLVAKSALTTLERLKQQSTSGATGFGSLTEKELALIENAIGNLKLSSSKDELQRGYSQFQDALLNARNRLIEKFQEKYPGAETGVGSRQDLFDRQVNKDIASPGRDYVMPHAIPIPFTDAGIAIPFTTRKVER